jgi:intracellular sulfur oxidation DsrE/DsrF family protein
MNKRLQTLYCRCGADEVKELLEGKLPDVIKRLQDFLNNKYSVQIEVIQEGGGISIEMFYSRLETVEEHDIRVARKAVVDRLAAMEHQTTMSKERMERYKLYLKLADEFKDSENRKFK